jgi:hypothetical protein
VERVVRRRWGEESIWETLSLLFWLCCCAVLCCAGSSSLYSFSTQSSLFLSLRKLNKMNIKQEREKDFMLFYFIFFTDREGELFLKNSLIKFMFYFLYFLWRERRSIYFSLLSSCFSMVS